MAVDDIINATEKGADLAISGSSNQPAGTQITVTLNGQNYTTTADASGNWSVTVPASRVSALGEATYTVTAAATDADGNSGSASHNVQVNTFLLFSVEILRRTPLTRRRVCRCSVSVVAHYRELFRPDKLPG
ncbi:Ig-like domain-containing protein [Escherichia coli]|uniref:Ig-like domain-containing protein n=1 Tax=Escherichia coli TaxID=562 RepID=UPI001ABFF77F